MSVRLLNEISLLPGVLGCCLLDKIRGPQGLERISGYSGESVADLGERLSRILQMSHTTSLAVGAVELRFDRLLLLGIPLSSERLLLVLCEADGNAVLVAHTARLLEADRSEDENDEDLPEEGIESIDLMEIEQEEDESAALSVQWSDETVKGVAFIREALIHTIGPVAVMLMQDYLARWTAVGPPELQRLPELMDLIAAALRDPARTAIFRAYLAR